MTPNDAIPEFTSNDIRWTSEPVRRIETIDPLTLTEQEFVDHFDAMRVEMTWLRAMIDDSLSANVTLTARVKAQQRAIENLHAEIRRLRGERR